MNARNYRVDLKLSPLDFYADKGLTETSISYRSEPPVIVNNKVVLIITKAFILTDMFTTKSHEVLKTQSVYEIPVNEIKTRDNVYEFYKDATLSLHETYELHRRTLPELHNILLATPPIENYQKEIDRIFDLLNSRN